jgi:hypothetical protein
MTSRFWIGEALRVDVTFSDETGTPVATSGVASSYRRAGASAVSIDPGAISNPSAGVYEIGLTPPQAGDYWVRVSVTAPSAAAVEIPFTVAASNVI